MRLQKKKEREKEIVYSERSRSSRLLERNKRRYARTYNLLHLGASLFFISLLSTFFRFANLPPPSFSFLSLKKILRKLLATLLVVHAWPKANTSVFETHLIAYNEPGMRLGWSGSCTPRRIRTHCISIFIGHSREPVISTAYEYRDAIVKYRLSRKKILASRDI